MDICSSRTCYSKKDIFTRELNVNYRCNKACEDCPIPVKNMREMPLEVVMVTIENAFLQASNNNYKQVDLVVCGGEVFLSFDLMQKLVIWITSKTWHLPYTLRIETNGTLLDQDIANWIDQYRHFLKISLICRPQWVEQINLNSIQNISDIVDVYLVVSLEDIRNLAKSIMLLHREGYSAQIRFRYHTMWTSNNYQQYIEQVLELLDYYLRNSDLKPVNIIDIASLEILALQWDGLNIECSAGVQHDFVDVNGKHYLCRKLSPLYMMNNTLRELLETLDRNELSKIDEKCNGCIYRLICYRCPVHSYTSTNALDEPNDNHCNLMKINIKLTCKYCAALLLQKQKKTPEDEAMREYVFKVIKLIQES